MTPPNTQGKSVIVPRLSLVTTVNLKTDCNTGLETSCECAEVCSCRYKLKVFHATEAYSRLDLTNVKYNMKSLSMDKKEKL
jgi:hypothetical protein